LTSTVVPSRWHLSRAVRVIRAGGVLAYPTEAVYGLGCDPLDAGAVERILTLKGRSAAKGLILIASELDQLLPYLAALPAGMLARMQADWPGPVTWVVPARPDAPFWLTGGRDTIAVRVTGHPGAAALCRAAGMPLVSTSANPSGAPPARKAWAVRHWFGDGVDFILPGPLGGRAGPSEIRDARSGRILRPAGA
jgi:L-threonylcarbamoyladenylate synthase